MATTDKESSATGTDNRPLTRRQQHSEVQTYDNHFFDNMHLQVFVINIPEEDVETKKIILDPDDKPMWESAKTENKFDGYLRVDQHDHIREFLAICDMFKYGETQSEAVRLLMFPLPLSDKAKTWFNELNEESITSSFSQNVCESLTDAWLRLKNMLRRCHGHGLIKGAIIQIFYPGLDEPTQEILNETAGGIFLYKNPNQAFQLLEDKVLFEVDWSNKLQMKPTQKSVAFADGRNSNDDNSRIMEKLEALTIKIDSQITSIKEELQDMRNKYYDLRGNHASKNRMNDDQLMCECHEANYVQYEGYQNQNSHDLYSYQSHHDSNDSEKSITELNNDGGMISKISKAVSVA
ncbi:hypothetical protein Tco_0697436 [Tanacetum coccineum]